MASKRFSTSVLENDALLAKVKRQKACQDLREEQAKLDNLLFEKEMQLALRAVKITEVKWMMLEAETMGYVRQALQVILDEAENKATKEMKVARLVMEHVTQKEMKIQADYRAELAKF